MLFLWIPSHMQKNRIIASILSWHNEDVILEKSLGVTKCAWPRAYEWTESYRCIYVCLRRHKKSNLYLNSFWDIANLLFSITLRMSDHTHLKWLHKFLTSLNSSPHAKNQLYCSTHSWDETDSWFVITMGMSRHAWPHPLEMT